MQFDKLNVEYYTTIEAFNLMKPWLCPFKHAIIYDPFPGPYSFMCKYLNMAGYNVLSNNKLDAFSSSSIPYWLQASLIVTNPPFNQLATFFRFVIFFNKPFIAILPNQVLSTSYFHAIFDSRMHDLRYLFAPQVWFLNAKLQRSRPGFATFILGYRVCDQ